MMVITLSYVEGTVPVITGVDAYYARMQYEVDEIRTEMFQRFIHTLGINTDPEYYNEDLA